ncbi:MAG: hypothetical protein A3E87_05645 [Gammaproteobacteria bacterium RIFCSPHIGHO2_12_FULL_35_23]|nr:MAG: hypothetical protein A3E87_05645 [Gammaproteobacteria bacterium RIFCSPHIGHO2_12_FULL_35_23]
MNNLETKHCKVCEGGISSLSIVEIKKQLSALPGWELDEKLNLIKKLYEFKGYAKTMAFVNAIAWIATVEGHHPDLEVSFNRCLVKYQTHAIGGITENDLICAAKVENLTQ